jgi:pimeloyl-ACP methyl ester carboxylesterase
VLAAPAGLAPHPAPVAAVAGRAGSALIAARRLAAPLAGSATARRLLLLGNVSRPAAVPAAEARAMLRGSQHSTRIGAAIAAVAAADLRPQLADLAVPCGFVWGARDRVVPLAAVRGRLAGRPVEVIAGAGHVPQLERPRELAAAVERVLAAITDR